MEKIMCFVVSFFMVLHGTAHAKEVLQIIVPFAAGGLTDTLARQASTALTEAGIENVVINKPGAAGVIGTKYARDNRNPSGTILALAGGPGLISPFMMVPQPYDIAKDFKPVALIATDAMAVAVRKDSVYKTLPDLIKAMQQQPGRINLGHATDMNRISGLMFMQKANTQANFVPFNGGMQALTALAGGHIDFTMSGVADAKPMLDNDKVRLLAVADTSRHSKYPDVPTFAEHGIDFKHGSFYAFYASLDTPQSVIDRFNAVATNRLRTDKKNEFLHEVLRPNFLLTRDLTKWYADQVFIWRPLIERNRPEK